MNNKNRFFYVTLHKVQREMQCTLKQIDTNFSSKTKKIPKKKINKQIICK